MSRLQSLGVKFPYVIAPMVGISHVAFRELVRHYTPRPVEPLLFTEMISSVRLPSEELDMVDELFTSVGESGLIPQLLANEERYIDQSIQKLRRIHPWGIDINMGCPAAQTLKHNWGVQLMRNKESAARVVEITKKYSPRPVSVKLRAALGREFDYEYLDEFTEALESAGADWLTLHCRTQAQGHAGYARWDIVQKIAVRRKIPVVANGDVQTWQDALKVMTEFQSDGVMIARAATARPWILWQIAYAQDPTLPRPPLTPEEEGKEYFAALLRLSCLIEQYYGDNSTGMRKFIFNSIHSSKWLLFGHDFLTGLKKQKNLVEIRDYINSYRENYPQPLLKHSRT